MSSYVISGQNFLIYLYLIHTITLWDHTANLYAEQKDGYTPLGLAAYNGVLCIVQFLVNNKGVDINSKNKNGVNPIDFAASRGYFEIVEFLVDKGAGQGAALHWAAYGGHLNLVKYLVDERHFNLHKRDKYGNRPSAKQRNKRQILFGGYKNLSHV